MSDGTSAAALVTGGTFGIGFETARLFGDPFSAKLFTKAKAAA